MRDANRRRNLGYFFDNSVARLPDKVCIIDTFGDRERCVTYAMLDQRMDRVAAMLARLGVEPGERVAMVVGNRIEFIEFFFGAMRMGAIPVLFNTRLAADTLTYIFQDADCAAALIDPGCNRDIARIAAGMPLRHRLALDDATDGFLSYEEEMSRPAASIDPPPIADDTQAFQPYTSGSTGRPKGALMTHRGMLWYIAHNQQYWPSSQDDRGLIALPLFHKNALRGTVKPMLFVGGSFVLMPRYEPRAYLAALAKYRCTYSRGVAAVFSMFLQHKDEIDQLDLSALRSMSIGSAVVAPELLDAVERALPGVKTSESYGLTEGGSPLRPPIDGRPVPRGSVGAPAPGVELKLLDASGKEHANLASWLSGVLMSVLATTTSLRSRVRRFATVGCIPAISSSRTTMGFSTFVVGSTTCSAAAGKMCIRRRWKISCIPTRTWSIRLLHRCLTK